MKRNLKNYIGIIIATIGLLCILSVPFTNYLITSFHPSIEREADYNVPYNWDSVKLIDPLSVLKARIHHPNVHVIGAIYNEKINLNTPVAEGVDNSIFSLCASTLYPNEKMGKGNYILAAHNVQYSRKALFSPVFRYVHQGSKINITNFNQNYTYKITSKKVISPQDYSSLSPTKESTLTLITCDRTNKKREVYIGKLIKTTRFSSLPQHTKEYLRQKFNY